jgi:hypothetical protein
MPKMSQRTEMPKMSADELGFLNKFGTQKVRTKSIGAKGGATTIASSNREFELSFRISDDG